MGRRWAVKPSDHLDRVFHALSDPTRRRIILRLAQGSASVSELAEPFDMSLPAVSQHLKTLEEAGFIERAVEGRVRRCHLDSRTFREIDDWLNPYRAYWEGTLEALGRQAEKGLGRRR
jgi:DNA-binding transcriptional ArsR family regulator